MPGDYIVPFGMKGTKKLQDFFVDEKIKKEERGRIPLVCLGQEVLWVVGRRINENYKVTEKTKEAIYIEFEPSA
jgi:tRNA(Ile)-lysidine synthase